MAESHKNQEELKKLILLAKEGDDSAFETIYKDYYTPLFRYILTRIKDKNDAEDMTQTVFMKIWKYLPSWKTDHSSPISFFFTVARNTMIDYFRKDPKKEVVSDEIVSLWVQDNGGSEGVSEERERSELMREAIAKLSTEQQEVINLFYMNDMTYQEIALITDKREDAIRQIHSRAIKKLRELYKI